MVTNRYARSDAITPDMSEEKANLAVSTKCQTDLRTGLRRYWADLTGATCILDGVPSATGHGSQPGTHMMRPLQVMLCQRTRSGATRWATYHLPAPNLPRRAAYGARGAPGMIKPSRFIVLPLIGE